MIGMHGDIAQLRRVRWKALTTQLRTPRRIVWPGTFDSTDADDLAIFEGKRNGAGARGSSRSATFTSTASPFLRISMHAASGFQCSISGAHRLTSSRCGSGISLFSLIGFGSCSSRGVEAAVWTSLHVQ